MHRRRLQFAGPDGFIALREHLAREAQTQRAARREARARLAATDHATREAESEAEQFRQAVAGAHRLRDPGSRPPERAPIAPLPLQRERDEREALRESLSDEIDVDSYLDTDESLSYRRPGVGPDVPRRLRRGEWAIRRQIDLHGLRVDEAREALGVFLAACARQEIRCARIIHGKGLGSVNREPVLKGKVMRWLIQRRDVLAFCRARPNDGGAGALIVLLDSP